MRRFSVVLPAGWERIDLVGDVDRALVDFRRRILARLPKGQEGVLGRALGPEWNSQLKQLAADGAYCLITSLDAGLFIGQPTLVVSPLAIPDGETPMDLLVGIASTDRSASLFDVADLVALRTTTDSVRTAETLTALNETVPDRSSEDAEGLSVTQRMHRYLLGDPVDHATWVIIAGTTTVVAQGDAPTEVLETYTDVMDDIVATFRWMS